MSGWSGKSARWGPWGGDGHREGWEVWLRVWNDEGGRWVAKGGRWR